MIDPVTLAILKGRLELFRLFEAFDRLCHFCDHISVDFCFRPAVVVGLLVIVLRQGDHAEGYAGPCGDLRLGLTLMQGLEIQPDQFRGAATDVEHKRLVAFFVEQRRTAGCRKSCLLSG